MQTKVKRIVFIFKLVRRNIIYPTVQGIKPTDLELMDLVTQKLDNKTIILLGNRSRYNELLIDWVFVGSPDMEIKSDYFNRVRMNTIQGKQVFCPIPFTEYHPALIYGDKRPPAALVFNTTAGHFDDLNTGHVSFYKADYLRVLAGSPSTCCE